MKRSITVAVRQVSGTRVTVTLTLAEEGKALLQRRFTRSAADYRELDQNAVIMLLDGIKSQIESWCSLQALPF